MDRGWMYNVPRPHPSYIRNLRSFIEAAKKHANLRKSKEILCPCIDCDNKIAWRDTGVIQSHLLKRGFKNNYTIWSEHGELDPCEVPGNDERVVGILDLKVDGKVDNVDANQDFEEFDCEEMLRHMEPEMLSSVGSQKGLSKMEGLESASKEPLYDESKGCDKEFTTLRTVLELLKLKASAGWSDTSFTDLLNFLSQLLPKPNKLPTSTYKAKKLISPIALGVQKIHACPNHCILYRGDFENASRCPVCNVSRYKKSYNQDCVKKFPKKNKNKKSTIGPESDDDTFDDMDGKKKSKNPALVMWYLPVIDRLKRLFSNPREAELMRWHAENRKQNNKQIRHPADASQWKNFDLMYPEFAKETRNVRFALGTDGMNPFGEKRSVHSTWPVTLTMYNLPSWLCHKRKYIMLTILIQGPKSAGVDIDVFLEPLMEDMTKLWNEGVRIWDEYCHEYFNLRAIIFVTIHDSPGGATLSGQKTKGKNGCVVCVDGTASMYLKSSKKLVFMGHRRFLMKQHKYRKMKEEFNNQLESEGAPKPYSGKLVFEIVKNIHVVFGKGKNKGEKRKRTDPSTYTTFKKQSIFFKYLPYWKDMEICHSIDLMHVTKNVFDSIIGTLLGMPSKTKDGLKSRNDLVDLQIRPELHPVDSGKGKPYLPPASYNLSVEERTKICKCLRGVKVPTGFSSNISRLVRMKDLSLFGYNSHDCHVMMTVFLPIAVRALETEHVKVVITRLCYFFNAVSQKVIALEDLDYLKAYIIETMCKLEMCFPPSFFDMQVHLIIHLVDQIKILGPLYLHHMFQLERYLGVLKGYVRNRAHPEGSIMEGYTTEEVIESCIDYISDGTMIGVPVPKHEGKLCGRGRMGKKTFRVEDYKLVHCAHGSVLQHLTIAEPYIEEHLDELRKENQNRTEDWIMREHKHRFSEWLMDKNIPFGDSLEEKTMKNLASGPSCFVTSWQAYDINGYTFYTKSKDMKSVAQNSGVRIDAFDLHGQKTTYFGFIEEIWELDYGPSMKIPLFKCQWVQHPVGVIVDNYGLTLVDLKKVGYKDDPWVLAECVAQVFYVLDPADEKMHVVISGKQKIVGVENVGDQDEEYNKYEEMFVFNGPERIKRVEKKIDKNLKPYMRKNGSS